MLRAFLAKKLLQKLGLVAFVSILSFIWFFSKPDKEGGLLEDLPIICPPRDPVRVKPLEEPSFFQGKKVYNKLDKSDKERRQHVTVEELLPPDELSVVDLEREVIPDLIVDSTPDSASLIPEKSVTSPKILTISPPQKKADSRPVTTPSDKGDPQRLSNKVASIDQILANMKLNPQEFSVTFRKSGRYSLQLGSLPTQEKAEKEWLRISQAHPDLKFLRHKPNFQRVDLGKSRGIVYRILLQGVVSRKDAQLLCKKLRERKVLCIVIEKKY